MVAEGVVRSYRSVKNSPRNFITGGKDELIKKEQHKSASAPVDLKIIHNFPNKIKVVDSAKKARKALRKFKDIKSTKDLERFVTKYERMIPNASDGNTT